MCSLCVIWYEWRQTWQRLAVNDRFISRSQIQQPRWHWHWPSLGTDKQVFRKEPERGLHSISQRQTAFYLPVWRVRTNCLNIKPQWKCFTTYCMASAIWKKMIQCHNLLRVKGKLNHWEIRKKSIENFIFSGPGLILNYFF